jgi:ABC-type antimicrobial peptide transport system permease subunit
VIRLGLRLAVSGGRVSMLRSAFTVVGVAFGVALILLIIAAQAAVQGREERIAWKSASIDAPATAPDGAWKLAVSDYYRGAAMTRVHVAALGPNPPVPPGLPRLPGAGEVAVSPAMARLLAAAPDDELDDRYPGRVSMTIGDAGLAHADELVAVVGMTPEALSEVRSAVVVRGFGALSGEFVYVVFIRIFLVLGAVLVLVPIVVFIVMATRIAAAQREQRLAAIRLVGATRGQTAVVAVVEIAVAVLAGLALGWGAYFLGRRALVANVTFQGGHFYLEDAVASPAALVVVAVGVLALTTAATVVSLKWVRLSPLGIARPSRPSVPGPWQVRQAIPLIIGLAGLLGVVPLLTSIARLLGRPLDEIYVLLLLQVYLLPAFLLTTLVGVVIAGPWLCALAGASMARLSRRASGMIAARRIVADPRAAFRAVSGVVVAAFALTFFATLLSNEETTGRERLKGERAGVVTVNTGAVPQEVVAPLVTPDVVVVRFRTEGVGPAEDWDHVVACADLARVRDVTCPYDPDLGLDEPTGPVDHLPVEFVHIPTDGSSAAQERTRTRAALAAPNAIIHVDGDPTFSDEDYYADLFRIFQIFSLAVLLVAGVSLSAGMVGALIERQRPFALLRATGVPLSQLRRVILLETAVPMVLTSVLGVGLGLLAANAVMTSQGWAWRWPDPTSLAIIGAGILAAVFAPLPALPLLNAVTRPEAVRYE